VFLLAISARTNAQHITVDITPGPVVNRVSPWRVLGLESAPLRFRENDFDPDHVEKMLSAGWGGFNYRLNTELKHPGLAWESCWHPERPSQATRKFR